MLDTDERFDDQRLTERECATLFAHLFPSGLAGDDVLAAVAPEGWERSPLLGVFHPSLEQVHREALRLHRNVRLLTRAAGTASDDREPTIADIVAAWVERPIEPDVELRELVGRCVWDVFSDGHDVIAPDGRLVDIGSFRAAADFVASLVNREIGEHRYAYLDFYLGTIAVFDRADLTPVYAMIFRRLARQGCDWKYTFPRLYALQLDRPDESVHAALERDRERAELHAWLGGGHRAALERAKDQPAPSTVNAYRRVYGRDPQGWPPWE